jgi:hypothetical protein
MGRWRGVMGRWRGVMGRWHVVGGPARRGEQRPILETRGRLGEGRDAATLTTTSGMIVCMTQDGLECAQHDETSSGSRPELVMLYRPEGQSSATKRRTFRRRILWDRCFRK